MFCLLITFHAVDWSCSLLQPGWAILLACWVRGGWKASLYAMVQSMLNTY